MDRGAELKPSCLCSFALLRQLTPGTEEVCGIHAAEGRLVALLGDGTVRSWELETLLCSS